MVSADRMVRWFLDHFEQAVECCPVDGGEYLFLYGGPYDPEEVFQQEYPEATPEMISEALRRLPQGDEWEAVPDDDEPYFDSSEIVIDDMIRDQDDPAYRKPPEVEGLDLDISAMEISKMDSFGGATLTNGAKTKKKEASPPVEKDKKKKSPFVDLKEVLAKEELTFEQRFIDMLALRQSMEEWELDAETCVQHAMEEMLSYLQELESEGLLTVATGRLGVGFEANQTGAINHISADIIKVGKIVLDLTKDRVEVEIQTHGPRCLFLKALREEHRWAAHIYIFTEGASKAERPVFSRESFFQALHHYVKQDYNLPE